MAKKRTFGNDFKRSFVKGLVVLLPTILTAIIFIQVYKFVRDSIGNPINRAAELVIRNVGLDEFFIRIGASREVDGQNVFHIPDLFGFIIAILIVYFVGSFFASFLGRRLWPATEKLMLKIPIFKVVYGYAKQVTDFFLEEQKVDYEFVVAVPYPRKGVYSIGFLTGDGMKAVSEAAGGALINVFIPSSPMPVTGYTIFVDPDELIYLDISVDQALRFTISGGVIIPPAQVQTLAKPVPAKERKPIALGADKEKKK